MRLGRFFSENPRKQPDAKVLTISTEKAATLKAVVQQKSTVLSMVIKSKLQQQSTKRKADYNTLIT